MSQDTPPPGHNSLTDRDLSNLKAAFARIRRARAEMKELASEIAAAYAKQAAILNVDAAALREIERWLRDPLAIETRDEQVGRFRPEFGQERHGAIAEREALRVEKEARKAARKSQKTAIGTKDATRDARISARGGGADRRRG